MRLADCVFRLDDVVKQIRGWWNDLPAAREQRCGELAAELRECAAEIEALLQEYAVEPAAGGAVGQTATEPAGHAPAMPKTKRSTERGEARVKLIARLTKHHKYADGGCLNLEPIGNNELAVLAGVSRSTASEFFNKEFNKGQKKGYAKYRVICRDAGRLTDSLKALNGEFSPYDLFARRPPGEDDRDDED